MDSDGDDVDYRGDIPHPSDPLPAEVNPDDRDYQPGTMYRFHSRLDSIQERREETVVDDLTIQTVSTPEPPAPGSRRRVADDDLAITPAPTPEEIVAQQIAREVPEDLNVESGSIPEEVLRAALDEGQQKRDAKINKTVISNIQVADLAFNDPIARLFNWILRRGGTSERQEEELGAAIPLRRLREPQDRPNSDSLVRQGRELRRQQQRQQQQQQGIRGMGARRKKVKVPWTWRLFGKPGKDRALRLFNIFVMLAIGAFGCWLTAFAVMVNLKKHGYPGLAGHKHTPDAKPTQAAKVEGQQMSQVDHG